MNTSEERGASGQMRTGRVLFNVRLHLLGRTLDLSGGNLLWLFTGVTSLLHLSAAGSIRCIKRLD